MRVTYIKHSGFLVEWEDIACLFDWAGGELPPIGEDKKLFVFISHAHTDHYDADIYEKLSGRAGRTFLLSDDIPPAPAGERALRLGPNQRRTLAAGKKGAMAVTTLGSTDQGVAFVVNYAGRTVYHAGDLHWWAWPDDTAAEEREMKNAFFAQIVKLKGMQLDAAFLPLDPRLGGNFWMGFDALMRSAQVKAAFPMHLWERYDTIEKLRQMNVSAPYRDAVMPITGPGQVFDLEQEGKAWYSK
ncbi:MAG: MBL fold metallo-hydrolase [Oscillospiraceae bacterium]|nr:MBL fold metallo-hydrolase [Oscillospiraceae bacterium]